MPIHIHNSLSRKKEEFVPINSPQVNMYTCGVTVYDESHIGHARSLYIFDVIRRYLKYRGFKVKFVRNITDIDDKIINRANELKVGWKDLVKKYIDRYYEDLNNLGIEKGDFEPRATENIEDMVKYIQALIDKGYAYEAQGDVYFNVRKFSGYGKLSGQSIDQMETGVRIEPAEYKKDPLDFALWKKSKENEPYWQSPWSNGRPGWHVECSVMSQKFLNTDTLDIHAGGRDLIFPHHENEIAQAEALTGKPFAKYWMHHGLLTINGQKMAKSLRNFVTIKDFLEKYKDVDILKMFFLSTHYSHPIDYNEDKIEESKTSLQKINTFFKTFSILVDRAIALKQRYPKGQKNIAQKVFMQEIDKYKAKFIKAMDDDFNAALALGVIFEIGSYTYGYINPVRISIECLRYAKDTAIELASLFGLLKNAEYVFTSQQVEQLKKLVYKYQIDMSGSAGLPKGIVQSLINIRKAAREAKDFKKADAVRQELADIGIILEDLSEVTIYRKI